MAEPDPVDGIYLITVPIPPGVLPEQQPIGPGTASVAFHPAVGVETLDEVAARVVDQGAVGARLIALDAAYAVELRLNPGVERV